MRMDEVDAALFAPDVYERMFALPSGMDRLLRWIDRTMKREHRWDSRTGTRTVVSASLAGSPREPLILRHPRGWPGVAHRHDFAELMYVHAGSIEHVVDERRSVLEAGDLCLLNPSAVHSFAPPGPGDVLLSIRYDRAAFGSIISPRSGSSVAAANAIVVRPDRESWIALTVRRLLFEYYARDGKDALATRLLLFLLAHDLLDGLPAGRACEGKASREQEVLREVFLYIAADPTAASLKGAAAALCVAPSTLSRLVSRGTGVSFTELVQRQRFQEARRLVRQTDRPIEDVLDLIGYSNRTYFYRQYRARFHRTPGQERRLARHPSSEDA
jgi:AraC-like DNA-binding protein/mannose-6-phosphate isomerase-like protein (cupin superfamily)